MAADVTACSSTAPTKRSVVAPAVTLLSCAATSCRSVICYFGHHYQAFVLSEELQQWLLFDDHVIKVVGDWQQVKQAMIKDRLQPSLLFYEAQDV